MTAKKTNRSLPIYELEEELVAALARGNRVVVRAPTGSGKSTQVPQILRDRGIAGDRRIVVLQPRRIAARMLARRVAAERGGEPGGEVGYAVRLEQCVSRATRIVYETDGIILRRLLDDPTLRDTGVVVFDEFHERRVDSDIMLALAAELQRTRRPDLKIVVMSATLDTERVAEYLDGCPVLTSEGRTYPVEIRHVSDARDVRPDAPWEAAAIACGELASQREDGDILVFMPGAYEIRRTIEALRRLSAARDCLVLALHGELPVAEQDRAVAPAGQRKIIVSTNVAETSLTIDGVVFVVDSGLARISRYDPRRGINTLWIEKISRASADQRAGRAGRTRKGICVRLWTKDDHAARPAQETPEIRRVDLAETLLHLSERGVGDADAFRWLDVPEADRLQRGRQLLVDLGALDGRTGSITDMGRRMLRFPLHPRYGRMLIEAGELGCVPTAALVCALSQERSILLGRQNRDVIERRLDLIPSPPTSDVQIMVAAWRHAAQHRFDLKACERLGIHAQGARRVGKLYDQFLRLAERAGLDAMQDGESDEPLRLCLLSAFSDQCGICINPREGRYAMVHGRRATLDRQSHVKAPLVVASEINEIGSSGRDMEVRLATVSALDPAWLRTRFPEEFSVENRVFFDTSTKAVASESRTLWRDLVLETSRGAPPNEEEAARILAEQVMNSTLKLKHWDHAVEQWIARVNLVAGVCPEMGVGTLGEDDRGMLIRQICHGAMRYKDIKDRQVFDTVRAALSAAQRDVVEKLAPLRIALANGRSPKVVYEPGQAPRIAMRIQELYDVKETPTIAMGRVKLQVHVLAPNHRPVQITDDLPSFWASGYEEAKKQLRGRYPKHEWR